MRLPDGTRMHRRLLEDDTIGTLRNWVKLQKLDKGDAVPDSFSIVMDYPRRQFDNDLMTLKEAGMSPRAAIIIHSLDDE